MSEIKIGDAAVLLGVSADTVRRWVDEGLLRGRKKRSGHRLIDGKSLADFARKHLRTVGEEPDTHGSARNRFAGIVTGVVKGDVVAQVEIQAGPHRVVSVMTREAAEEVGLEEGVLATAVVKATQVVVERM